MRLVKIGPRAPRGRSRPSGSAFSVFPSRFDSVITSYREIESAKGDSIGRILQRTVFIMSQRDTNFQVKQVEYVHRLKESTTLRVTKSARSARARTRPQRHCCKFKLTASPCFFSEVRQSISERNTLDSLYHYICADPKGRLLVRAT
jgi:hypothetical protein